MEIKRVEEMLISGGIQYIEDRLPEAQKAFKSFFEGRVSKSIEGLKTDYFKSAIGNGGIFTIRVWIDMRTNLKIVKKDHITNDKDLLFAVEGASNSKQELQNLIDKVKTVASKRFAEFFNKEVIPSRIVIDYRVVSKTGEAFRTDSFMAPNDARKSVYC